MLPSFIIIGAMKCGTTSLYEYLAPHPDLGRSTPKETNFFLTPKKFSKGVQHYESLFKTGRKIAFEASPNYTKRDKFPGVPSRMHSVVPDAKLVYIMRNPVKRIISHYLHFYANRHENSPFSEALLNSKFNYIECSRYYYQLEAFLEYYSKDQLYCMSTEDLSQNPEQEMKALSNFLEIPYAFDLEKLKQRVHVTSEKKRVSKLEYYLSLLTSNPKHLWSIHKRGRRWGTPMEIPVPSEADMDLIKTALIPDLQQLRAFTGRQFTKWSL